MPPGTADETAALFWLVATGICQQTRTLDGTIGGRRLRGSDYLFAALLQHLARHPDRWTPPALTTWTLTELQGAVSDDGNPPTSTLDRLAERLRLLRGIGKHIASEHADGPMSIWSGCDRRVETLLGRLAAMEAYVDPVAKKSHLLLMFLHECGLWPLADPENLEIAIDYHVMRVALRTGIVEVEDPELRRRLTCQDPVTEAEDTAIRLAVREACRTILAGVPELSRFRLDNLLWMIGRNCCFYEHPPVCTEPGACWKLKGCSYVAFLGYPCDLSCPLSGICRGATDEDHRALRETRFDTHYY